MIQLRDIIQTINADTIERVLVFAALLLRKLNLVAAEDSTFVYKNSVRISPGIIRNSEGNLAGKLSVETSLFYDSIDFLTKGGNLYSAIDRYTNLSDFVANFVCLPSSDNFDKITDLPFYIESPEQLFYWAAQVLFLSLTPEQKIINFQVLEENTSGATVKVTFDLPFDYYVFVSKNNLVEAIKRVTNIYSFPVGNSSNSASVSNLSNNSILNNSFVVGN